MVFILLVVTFIYNIALTYICWRGLYCEKDQVHIELYLHIAVWICDVSAVWTYERLSTDRITPFWNFHAKESNLADRNNFSSSHASKT